MTLGGWLRRRLRLLVARRKAEAQVDDELRLHIELETADRIHRGMTPDEARRTTLADFGRAEKIKDDWRDQRPLAWLDALSRDSVFALRAIRRSPAFASSVVLVSALGIGATTTMFGVVNGVLLRPLPFPEAHRLFDVELRDERGNAYGAGRMADDTLRGSPLVERTARYTAGSVVLSASDGPERLRTELVTADMLPLLGTRPLLGRNFTRDEESGATVALLGHGLWRRRFGGDSSIVGRTITVDGGPMVVVGVMPPGFTGARPWLIEAPALWMPLDRQSAGRRAGLLVRVREGVPAAALEAWLAATTSVRVPNITGTDSVIVHPELDSVIETTVGNLREPLAILFAAVCFVLLLVSANVATLLLARAAARERELAVRRALGASRVRQVRHVVLESLVLAILGGMLGLVLALWGTAAVKTLGADFIPRLGAVSIDWRVLTFAMAITLGSGLAAGIIPAVVGSAHSLTGSLTGAARLDRGAARWGGVRGALVVVEIALSLVLLIGAGLMLKSFMRVMPAAPGFDVVDRVRVQVRLDDVPSYVDSIAGPERRRAFAHGVLERMRTVEGVRDVTVTRFVPFVRESAVSEVRPDGAPRDPQGAPLTAHHRSVAPNYFDLMGMSLRSGRAFSEDDRAGAPRVVIVNETAARRWWPDQNALGRTVLFTEGSRAEAIATVVGVVRDARFDALGTRSVPELFVPFDQAPPRRFNFVVLASNPRLVTPELRRAVWAVDPNLPVAVPELLEDIAGEVVAEPRFYSVIMGAFAVIAIVLSAAGIHGVLVYTVARRSREIGIRMALGSARRDVMALVLRQGMALAGLGIVIGVAAAIALTRVLQSVLYEVSTTDPWVFAATVVLLAGVAAVACLIPALRAARVDPLRVMKTE